MGSPLTYEEAMKRVWDALLKHPAMRFYSNAVPMPNPYEWPTEEPGEVGGGLPG